MTLNHSVSKNIVSRTILPAAICLALATQYASAQTARLPGVVDKEVLKPNFDKPLDDFLPEGEEVKPPSKPKGSDKIVTSLIKHIDVSGVNALSEELVEQLKQPYLGRPLSENDLLSLKYDITKAYFDKGYILVKVATPPQNTSRGVLKVTVVEGRIDEVRFENDVVHEYVAEGLFSRINKGDIFHENDAETTLNDLDSLKNVEAQLRLEAGKEFGSTRLNVHTEEVKEDVHYLEYNNHGSRIVSRDVITLGLQKSNLLTLGETVDAQLNYGPDELHGGRIQWFSPIPSTDLFFSASYALNDIDIGGRFRALNATGESESFRADVSRNFLNTNTQKLTALLGIEHRQHKSFLSDTPETEDNISKLRGSLSYLHRWHNALAYIELEALRGVSLFGATDENDTLATRTHNPNAWMFLPTLIVQRKFSEKDQLSARINGQYATSTLLSSDLFAIGGYDSVRGFEPGQETGESGVGASLEYKRHVYSDQKFDVAVRPFIDAGIVYNRLNNTSLDSHLYGGGVGLDIDIDNDIEALGFTRLSFDAATSLGGYEAETQQNAYLYFRAKQEF